MHKPESIQENSMGLWDTNGSPKGLEKRPEKIANSDHSIIKIDQNIQKNWGDLLSFRL